MLAPLINYLPEKQKGYSLPKNRNSLPEYRYLLPKVSELTNTFPEAGTFDLLLAWKTKGLFTAQESLFTTLHIAIYY